MQDEQLTIIYQDDYLAAVDKPAGLLVHRSMIDRHETRYAMQLLRNQLGRWVYPLHRLDKPTSGVLLFALSQDTARDMGALFEQSAVEKTYLALVRGFTDAVGIIDHPLKEKLDKLADRQADQDKPAQPAVSRYRRLATLELPIPVKPFPTSRYCLLEVSPETGRKHQIRRHMKHISHPVIGDTSYGKSEHNRLFKDNFDCGRLLLAAVRMAFRHPYSGREIVIEQAPGDCFSRLLDYPDWQWDTPLQTKALRP